jgi:predicted peptidase
MSKTSLIFRFLLFSSIIFFGACDKSATMDPEPMRTFADVEADFQALDISPGVHDVSLEILNGVKYDFRVIVPEKNPTERRPLVLTFHGATTSNDAHKNTACYAEPGLDTLHAFILSPFAEGGLWYQDRNLTMMADLVYLVKKFWPIEEDKIAVTGYSNGGNASWLFGKFQSSTISAAIPMASSYDVHELDGSVAVWDIPLYVIHGENDELFPLEVTKGWVEETNEAGSDVTFVVAPDLGHYTPCDYVPYLKEAAIWLKETVWMD